MAYPYYNQPYQYYQNPYYQNPYQQQSFQQQPQAQGVQQQAVQQNVQPVQPQIQNGGFISVPNIETARNWPIAPGNSVTFKDESAPYIYTKTMGYNQLDTPRFERFKLVKEEDAPQMAVNAPTSASNDNAVDLSGYALKTELEPLQDEIEGLKKRIEELTEKKQPARAKKEEKDDA